MAFSPSSRFTISTNPNPRERPGVAIRHDRDPIDLPALGKELAQFVLACGEIQIANKDVFQADYSSLGLFELGLCGGDAVIFPARVSFWDRRTFQAPYRSIAPVGQSAWTQAASFCPSCCGRKAAIPGGIISAPGRRLTCHYGAGHIVSLGGNMVRAHATNSPPHPQRRLVALEPKELLALVEAAKEHSPRAHAMVLLASAMACGPVR
jgi:hypothetical protein